MTDQFETLDRARRLRAGCGDRSGGAADPDEHHLQAGRGGPDAGGFEYGRSDNPTRQSLESAIAALEGAKHGFAYASGLAATQNLLYLTEPGQRILMCDDVYGGTWRLADKVWSRYGVTVDPVDVADPAAVARAPVAEAVGERGPVAMVWIETPTNPAPQDRGHQRRSPSLHARPAH